MNETSNVNKNKEEFLDIASIVCYRVGSFLSMRAIFSTAAILNLALRYNREINRESIAQPATEFAIGMACTGLSAIL